MRRRDFLKRSAAALVASSVSDVALLSSARKPSNLLFITVDDMNWSLPDFMGGRHGLTPNLDKLASQSHRFVRNRTTAPICQPSREAMMTGRVPHRSGALGFTPIDAGIPTMVTVLKDAAYYNATIHKTEHMQPPSCFPWDHAIPGENRKPSEYGQGVSDAIAAAQKESKPFFVVCNINDPHRPFYGARAAATMDHNDEGEYAVPRLIRSEEVDIPPILEDLPAIREELSQYYNSAQRMDISIGRALQALKDSGAESDTIVFFSADHGMPFPFSKATTYDYGTRTPTLIRYPGMSKPKTFEDLTCNIDYMPTLLDLLQVTAPKGMDGRSWIPRMHGAKGVGREFVVTHVNGVNSGAEYPSRAIQDDRYSLMFTPWCDGRLKFRIESMQGLTYPAMVKAAETDPQIKARVEQFTTGTSMAFFDLQEDPGQRVNLMDRTEHRKRIQRMTQALHEYMKSSNDPQCENLERVLAGKPAIVIQPHV
ncbi:sulfatase [Terriglobus saanensis SP1PR4]|uniref:Sulfatase n=2 Tax=Terriglobus saanensis TaxID=870903 RepID=E8V2J1_TERSS|nr:sulfatase [Terriglobus saanensis SP1PR4]